MEKHDKEKKSVHLKELEEVFEAKTRRFSPFAVLGLTQEYPREQEEVQQDPQETEISDDRPTPGSDRTSKLQDRPTPGSKIIDERGISSLKRGATIDRKSINTNTYTRPTPGSDTPMGGVGDPPE